MRSLTTARDMAHRQCALEAGANEYLMKPFTSEMVVAKPAKLALEHN